MNENPKKNPLGFDSHEERKYSLTHTNWQLPNKNRSELCGVLCNPEFQNPFNIIRKSKSNFNGLKCSIIIMYIYNSQKRNLFFPSLFAVIAAYCCWLVFVILLFWPLLQQPTWMFFFLLHIHFKWITLAIRILFFIRKLKRNLLVLHLLAFDKSSFLEWRWQQECNINYKLFLVSIKLIRP